MLTTYQEAGAIRTVLAEVREAAAALAFQDIETTVLLVDDQSPDGTADIARSEAEVLGLKLEVLSGTKNGLGRAVLRGFSHGLLSQPDFFVTLDADGQHDARQIPDLVRAFLAAEADLMIGSRFVLGGSAPGMTKKRRVMGRGGNLLFRTITETRGVKDATTSFRIIKREVVAKFDPSHLNVEGYAFFSAFIAVAKAHGFVVKETPITFRPRLGGASKLTLGDCTFFLQNLLKVRTATKAIKAQRYMDMRQRSFEPATNEVPAIRAVNE